MAALWQQPAYNRGHKDAPHCGPVNNNVRTPDGGLLVGKTELKKCGPAPYNSDVQLIAGQSYENKIYVGTTQAGSRADVIEAGTPAIGTAYNFSGATRWEQTGQIVRSLTGQWWANFCGTTFWVLNLIVFNKSSICDVRDGDSGAPFYFKGAGSPYPVIRIRGMVVARDNNSGPNCYAMQYTRIRDLLGYSILTVP